jgi:hypothetical protein
MKLRNFDFGGVSCVLCARICGGTGADLVRRCKRHALRHGPTVTVSQNVVRGQQAAGQIWVIDDLYGQVSANGSITVHGKGWFWAAAMALGGAGRTERVRHPELSIHFAL